MKEIVFDFERIGTMDDFYTIAIRLLNTPEYFGKNLDALWDWITGGMETPVSIQFINMTLGQLETFDNLTQLFEEASEELGENFSFGYYIRKA
ncbi:MAG TPA: barstar family protein [Niabella sp.]|nr:barstar family protein [Niabella sp.]HOZ97744.1 barstar family protein [Niabella sp.]HQW14059.1 barstar family protein [Niabella sp.]HQX19398.1 barstar family protein [Niabella sp.]HQX40249.1 barstar family protein [Niabella sp.]